MKPDLLDPVVSIVTKLKDHEQVPSEELKPPMVSLIQSGDHAKTHNLYRMFLSCILPKRFRIRRRQNSTLSMCGYVKALRKDWVCVPGQFTLPSTCMSSPTGMSRSRTQESSMVMALGNEDNNSVEQTDISYTSSASTMETSTQSEKETQAPCFIPTQVSTQQKSTTANEIPSEMQVTTSGSEASVKLDEVTHQETKTNQDLPPPPSPVLSTSQNTMDKTETAEVKQTASVPVRSTQTTEIVSAAVSTANTDVEESSGQELEPSLVIEVGTTAATETPKLHRTESLTTSSISQEPSLSAPSSTAAPDNSVSNFLKS